MKKKGNGEKNSQKRGKMCQRMWKKNQKNDGIIRQGEWTEQSKKKKTKEEKLDILSVFVDTKLLSIPFCWRVTNAIWVGVGSTSKEKFLSIVIPWACFVQTPDGPLKSGIPSKVRKEEMRNISYFILVGSDKSFR